MSHYKPYPAYKDSGVEWLGRIPEHWEITPLKYEAEFINGAAFKPEQWSEIGTPIIRIENLNGSLNFNCFDGEMDARYHVEQGDLLFGWSGNRGTSFGPFIWQHAGRHYLNQHIFRICNFKFDKAWFYWSLKAVTAHVEDQAHGIIGMVHITKGDLGAIKIATPAPAEQQAISVHLNRETARIDALIEKKTRFIELLLEKRQALITHAVTRGLDPSVKMKDSGVEWLGEVPEHWEVLQLRHTARLESGHTPSRSKPEYWVDCTVPWFTLADVWQVRSGEQKYVSETSEMVSQLGLENSSARLLPAGSVFLSRTASVGFTGIMAVDMATSQDFAVWTCTSELFNEYLYYVLLGMKPDFDRLMMGSTHKTIYMPDIEAIRIARPPVDEQRGIVSVLSGQLGRFKSVIDKTERSIELLKERRSALITAAVTGQIDLREQACH